MVMVQGKTTEKRCDQKNEIRKDSRAPRVLCNQNCRRFVGALCQMCNGRRDHGGSRTGGRSGAGSGANHLPVGGARRGPFRRSARRFTKHLSQVITRSRHSTRPALTRKEDSATPWVCKPSRVIQEIHLEGEKTMKHISNVIRNRRQTRKSLAVIVLLIALVCVTIDQGPSRAAIKSSTQSVVTPPANVPMLPGSFAPVNVGPGDQTGPHVYRDRVSYTNDDFAGTSAIHYFDFSNG